MSRVIDMGRRVGDGIRFDADLDGFVAYVERLRSAPHPTLNVASACATPAARARKKLA